MIRALILSFFAFSLSSALCAQQSKAARSEEIGDQRYTQGQYYLASEAYQEALSWGFDRQICLKLASSYQKIQDFGQAEFWFRAAMQNANLDPLYYKQFADVLRANEKHEEALNWYQLYDRYAEQPGIWESPYWPPSESAEDPKVSLQRLDFNTGFSDLSPSIVDGGLIIASNRKDKSRSSQELSAQNGQLDYDLYFIPLESGLSFGEAQRLKGSINSWSDELGLVQHRTSQQYYFTRNRTSSRRKQKQKGNWNSAIYFAPVKSDDESLKLGRASLLAFAKAGSNTAHPTISSDGKTMVFSADFEGSYGGMDLWISHFENGQWSEPRNLGPQINGKGNEVFPYLANSGWLIFSSDSQPGLGGLDLFESYYRGNIWTTAKNMEAPLNSTRDDFGLVMQNFQGYFCSNRLGSRGQDDIYAYQFEEIEIEIEVVNAESGAAVQGANVELIFSDSGIQSFQSSSEGKVQFKLQAGLGFYLSVSKSGFRTEVLSDIKNQKSFRIELRSELP